MCDAVLDVEEDELDEGDALTCEECGANVTVVGTSPIELEATDDEDDEDEDEDTEDSDFDEDEDEDEDDDEDEEEDWK
jgi:hypothetical protein